MKIQETVIIEVSMIGLADKGSGTATFEIDTAGGDVLAGAARLAESLEHALGLAMADLYPAFADYIKTKYAGSIDSGGDL